DWRRRSAPPHAVLVPGTAREAKERAVLGSRDHPFRAPDGGPAQGFRRTPRRERRLQSGGLMPEFFAQELLNSFFRLFCKALRVVDGVSVSNVNRRDPQPSNLSPIGRDLEPILVFRRGLPLRPHVVLTAPIDPKAFDARHRGPYTYVVLTATPEPPTGEFAFLRILRTDVPVLPDCGSNRKPGKFGFLMLAQCSSD